MDQHQFESMAAAQLQERLGYPDERGLIEILNRYEYQLYLEEKSPLNNLGDGGQERRLQVSILRDHLSRQQGELDRFKLRGVSTVELEHLAEETQVEIDQLNREAAPRPQTVATDPLSNLFKGFTEIAFGTDPVQYQLFTKKKLLSEIRLQIKRNAAIPATPPPPAPPKPSAEEQKRQKRADLEKQMAEARTAFTRRMADSSLTEADRRKLQNDVQQILQRMQEEWSKTF